MARKTAPRKPKKSRTVASIVWFEVPADDIARAKRFYRSLTTVKKK